ncbi:hypothetical protein ACF053_19340 [Streptomyces kanasensis]|uniref:hypothetical protein n=1 Tax=Streptomyces kanasensis TaxID=936756 RepID=UPI0036FEBA3F
MSSRRAPLPPPPPPPHLRSWPDRAALLADRDRALTVLGRASLGGGRLALFLVWLLVLEVGWSLLGAAWIGFDEALDPLGAAPAFLLAGAGLATLVPAGFFQVGGVRRDVAAHRLLVRWAALDRAPERDARHRAAGRSLAWLLVSFALGAAGLALCVGVPAAARPGTTTYAEVGFGVGAGLLLWVHGLVGGVRAVAHFRTAVRLLSPVRPVPRAARPASSARPPHA